MLWCILTIWNCKCLIVDRDISCWPLGPNERACYPRVHIVQNAYKEKKCDYDLKQYGLPPSNLCHGWRCSEQITKDYLDQKIQNHIYIPWKINQRNTNTAMHLQIYSPLIQYFIWFSLKNLVKKLIAPTWRHVSRINLANRLLILYFWNKNIHLPTKTLNEEWWVIFLLFKQL